MKLKALTFGIKPKDPLEEIGSRETEILTLEQELSIINERKENAYELNRESPTDETKAAFAAAQLEHLIKSGEIAAAKGALERFKKIHEDALMAAKRAKKKARFTAAEKKLNQAEILAVLIQKDAEVVMENLARLNELCTGALVDVPRVDESGVLLTDGTFPSDSALSERRITGAFRLLLRKHGHQWASYWFEDVRKIPTMLDAIKEGKGWLMQFAPKE